MRRFHRLATQRRHNATLAQLLELPPQQRATALATLRAEAVEEEMKADTFFSQNEQFVGGGIFLFVVVVVVT